jgi:FkbM family methyltransferase
MTGSPTPSRALRVLKRAKKAAQIGFIAKNFVDVWGSILVGRELDELRLRDGLIVGAPRNVHLWNHFNEIWLERVYTRDRFDIGVGSTVVDIGANIGLFSLLAARSAARVFSFEPFADSFDWLSKNIERNQLSRIIHPINLAVGRDAGTRTFYVHPQSTSNNFYETKNGQPVVVACTTLKNIIEEHCQMRCDFLKLDCEGSEFEILLGATDETLKMIGAISLEVHEGLSGHSRTDLENRLANAGFSIESRQDMYGCLVMKARNKTFEVR